MPQDKLSVHVGINHRISLIYKDKMVPTLSGSARSIPGFFGKSAGTGISRALALSPIWAAVWVPEKGCYCYKSRVLIPMRFNDPLIYGIVVESEPNC